MMLPALARPLVFVYLETISVPFANEIYIGLSWMN